MTKEKLQVTGMVNVQWSAFLKIYNYLLKSRSSFFHMIAPNAGKYKCVCFSRMLVLLAESSGNINIISSVPLLDAYKYLVFFFLASKI